MAVLPVPPPPQKSDTLIRDEVLFRWLNIIQKNMVDPSSGVLSFNKRTGTIYLQSSDVVSALGYLPAPLSNPAFTGVPTAPTAPIGTNSNQIATTAFVISHTGSGSNQGYGTGGSTDEIFFLNQQAVTNSFIIPPGFNSHSVGPITISPGATVVISEGSFWFLSGN